MFSIIPQKLSANFCMELFDTSFQMVKIFKGSQGNLNKESCRRELRTSRIKAPGAGA